MRALTWQGPMSVAIRDVPDPVIQEPTDAIIRVTSAAICGSDIHLYDVLGPFLHKDDVLGHEAMGVVEEVGGAVTRLRPGDRVVVPFVIACGECWMCRSGLQTQCETTQRREQGAGASLYGYTEIYGSIPGGQAERLRVVLADANAIVVGQDLPDDRYLFLSDILPTAWQAIEYAGAPEGGSIAVLGLGPVGQFVARIARHLGYEVTAVEPVAERRVMASRHGIEAIDLGDETVPELRRRTHGRGPDAVIDAVGMEAHGEPAIGVAQHMADAMPGAIGKPVARRFGMDRLGALELAIEAVRRGGTLSLAGVYGGVADPLPMLTMFDKQLTIRMGQCNVQRWIPDLLPLVEHPSDPLGTEDLVTHRIPLEEGAPFYKTFRDKQDGCIKVVLAP